MMAVRTSLPAPAALAELFQHDASAQASRGYPAAGSSEAGACAPLNAAVTTEQGRRALPPPVSRNLLRTQLVRCQLLRRRIAAASLHHRTLAARSLWARIQA